MCQQQQSVPAAVCKAPELSSTSPQHVSTWLRHPTSFYVSAVALPSAVHALMGIYNKLNGKNWTFHHLTEVIGHAETGTLRWGSCSTCTVPHTTISSGRHGTISLQALTLPAYCCWRGVSCCSEPLGSPSNTGFSVSNTLHAEHSRGSCKRHSVTALQLWGLQLSGAFHSIMPELQVGFRDTYVLCTAAAAG